MNWNNPEERKKYQSEWYQKNKKLKNLQSKIWRQNNIEKDKKIQKNCYLKLKNNTPWIINLRAAIQRCTNPNRNGYDYYGGIGIKCLLTVEEIKKLWFRDKAYEMKQPSIDRKDSTKDYVYSNCRFIEMIDNQLKFKSVRNKKGQFTK